MKKHQLSLIFLLLLAATIVFSFGRHFVSFDTDVKKNQNLNSHSIEKNPADKTDAATLKKDLKSLGFSGDIQLVYNQKKIPFARDPQIFGQEVYVPVTELSTALGFYVRMESDRYLNLYKNNMFIKLDLESNLANVNGKPYDISSGPYYSDNRIYVPLLFLLNALHYDVAWDKATGEIALTDNNANNQFDFIDQNNYYKRVEIADLGARVSVPVHWALVDEKTRTYGYTDDFEYFTLSISSEKVGEDDSLSEVTDQLKSELLKDKQIKLGKVLQGTKTQLPSFVIHDKISLGKKTYQETTYVFKDKQTSYRLHFRFGDYMDPEVAGTMVDTIADSFQINKLSIQQRDEFYVEFPEFYRLGVNLKGDLYANTTQSDFVLLKGTVANSIDGFNVRVSKDSQSIVFFVPVKNKQFEQKIFLPFGLGKHTVYIQTAEQSGLFKKDTSHKTFEPIISTDEDNVLEFSVINISNSSIRYLIPSSRIPSDQKKFSDLANLLTYKEENSYKKSKAVYHWIEKNIAFDPATSKDKLRSPAQVFDRSEGSEEELAYFYATLLRAIDIPCRVVTGEFDGDAHFWNELYINGKWIVADLGEEFNKGDGITAYFNLSRTEHYSDYTNIKVLDY